MGSKIETYYIYDDEDLGRLKVKVTESFDVSGKQIGIARMEILKEILGPKGVKIHNKIWEMHDGKKS